MNVKQYSIPILLILMTSSLAALPAIASGQAQGCDISTLACKVLTVNSTPGLHVQMSNFVQAEASEETASSQASDPITPTFVLTSPLDGLTVLFPDVTVNQDAAAAPQNEPMIAVNPNNPSQIVAAANDYVTRTWTCFIGSTPCSALGDGYSGTYFSNDGGATWCCVATNPSTIGTLIPGVEHLVGGSYDAGGDPSLAFNSAGNVYYAGLGFDRRMPPNTVEVSKGTFSDSVALSWGAPTFINPTTSPSIFNDKPWIGADSHASSPFKDNIYVSWTKFIFNPANGAYIQSPIFFVHSTDGGATFSTPTSIVGNVLYDQGSHIVVGPDGTIYVFWDGSTRLPTFDSIWMTKSGDGGITWSSPVAVSQLVDIAPLQNTHFRVNSFPAADIGADGKLYVAWTSDVLNSSPSYSVPNPVCAYFISGTASVYANCHSAALYTTSSNGGATWNLPALIFPTLDAATQTAVGYAVTQPDGSTLNAPSPTPRDDAVFPSVAAAPTGQVYMSAYIADVISPWQTCATPASPTAVGRIDCLSLGNFISNARLDYAVADLSSGVSVSNIVTSQPINSRYQFGGGFMGDYTGIAADSNGNFHAVWTDTNNLQTVVWWYGFQFEPTSIHQQDIATDTGSF